MFEVGKKYKKSTGVISVCVWIDEKYALLHIDGTQTIPFVRLKEEFHQYTEYKEPRSLTRWLNIWQNASGKLVLGDTHHYSKEDAVSFAERATSGGWKLLDTIEVKWVEKNA